MSNPLRANLHAGYTMLTYSLPDESKPRKRGRPPKSSHVDSPNMSAQPLTPATPNTMSQVKSHTANHTSPSQTSPRRVTPSSGSKQPVLKALPTVRDHTTDQLNPEGDEYIPREKDDAGEKKVDLDGNLVNREYRIRIFTVPNRANKLFMLATECARVLGYRDSYLLFNKNRSLFKIIANQEEKDNLIQQEILPYSYRSRQIAIVTARSMFRQFGSRVVVNGRRVRDDYWESKARKQGFTEDDAAGEKRPGAAKQREAAAQEAHAISLAALPHGEIIYTNAHGMNGQPQVPPGIHPITLASLPLTDALSSDHLRTQDFPQVIRPRQEIAGPAYQDRSQSSSVADILGQSTSSAEFNRQLTQQRAIRSTYLDDYWKRPHEVSEPADQTFATDIGASTIAPQNLQSPQQHANISALSAQQNLMSHQQNAHTMAAQNYQQQYQQNMPSQSPVRPMHQSLPSAQLSQTSPAVSMSAALGNRQQTPSYNYQAGGMWPPPQPQQSPHQMQYGLQQQTPQSQPQQSPMHPPSQMPHQNSMNYMGASMNNAGFGGMNRNMYQGSPTSQQYGQQQQQQQQQGLSNIQGWGQTSTTGLSSDWQRGFQ